MKLKEIILFSLLLFFVFSLFFGLNMFAGKIPFPGDLLISEYTPWKTYSYLGYVPGSYPSKAQYFDVLRQIYPWKNLVIQSLKNFQIPLWNPYNFSGSPLLANFQSSVFYPFNVVYLFTSQVYAWSMIVFLQPILAVLFTYLYSRQRRISSIGASIAALSFGFSSFMNVWLEYNTIGHVILWLPFLLFVFEKHLETKKNYWILFFGFGIFSSLFAGHIQIFAYVFVFTLIYVMFRLLQSNNKKLISFWVIVFLLSLGLGAIQLFPGIELILNSARSSHTYDSLINKMLIQPWQLLMFFVPDFFGNPANRNYWPGDTYIGKVLSIGIVPLLFVSFLLFSKKESLARFFLWVSLSVLVLTTVNPITIILYKFDIPFFSSSSSTLAIFILCFCLSILAGIGFDNFSESKLKIKQYLLWIVPFFVLFIFMFLAILFLPKFTDLANLKVGLRPLILSFTIFLLFVLSIILLKVKKLKPLFIYFFVFLTLGELFLFFNKFNPFVSSRLVFPPTPITDFLKTNAGISRFWGYGGAYVEANFATQYRIFSPDGYDPLYPKIYGEFLHASSNGKLLSQFSDETRSDAVVAKGFGGKDFYQNEYRLKILDVLGVKYILDRLGNGSDQNTFPEKRFNLVYSENDWKVFENLKSAPRAFLTSSYRVYKTNNEFERYFFDKGFNPSNEILVLENFPFVPSSYKADVKVISYKENEIKLKSNSSKDAALFLSDTYYPGWNAYLDGKLTKIYKADYAFRAIYFPKGEHVVEFKYEPVSFKIGLGVSAVSFFLLILLTFLKFKK